MEEIEKRKIVGKYAEKYPKKFKEFLKLNNKFNDKEDKIDIKEYFDEEGYLDLDNIHYIVLMNREQIRKTQDAYYVEKWILTPNLKEVLVKNHTDFDIDINKLTYENRLFETVCKYNSLFVPEIFQQVGLETAEYYWAKEKGKEYILTPSVLEKNEQIINGDTILDYCGDENEKYVSTELKSIERYVRNVLNIQDTDKINEIREMFILKVIMARYLGIEDFHSGDWGIIYNDKTKNIRNLPVIDVDYGLNIENTRVFDESNLSDKKTNNFEDLIIQYYDLRSVKNLLKKIQQINIEKAIENVYFKKHIKVPIEVQNYYRMYFGKMNNRVENLCNELYEERNDEEK